MKTERKVPDWRNRKADAVDSFTPTCAVLGQAAAERKLRTGKAKEGYAVLTEDRLWFCHKYLQGKKKRLSTRKGLTSIPVGQISEVTLTKRPMTPGLLLCLIFAALAVVGLVYSSVMTDGLILNWKQGTAPDPYAALLTVPFLIQFRLVQILVAFVLTLAFFFFLWHLKTGGKLLLVRGIDLQYGILLKRISDQETEAFRLRLLELQSGKPSEKKVPASPEASGQENPLCGVLGKESAQAGSGDYAPLSAEQLVCCGKETEIMEIADIVGMTEVKSRPAWAARVGKILGAVAIGTGLMLILGNGIWHTQLRIGVARHGCMQAYTQLLPYSPVEHLSILIYLLALFVGTLWAFWGTLSALVWPKKLMIHSTDRYVSFPADRFAKAEINAFRDSLDRLQGNTGFRSTPELTGLLLQKPERIKHANSSKNTGVRTK